MESSRADRALFKGVVAPLDAALALECAEGGASIFELLPLFGDDFSLLKFSKGRAS